MEPLTLLPDGRIVVISTLYIGSGPVWTVRVYAPGGAEITSEAVAFGAGTPVGEPYAGAYEFNVLPDSGGGVRIVARSNSTTTGHVFHIDAAGSVAGSDSFDTSANDATVPFITVYENSIQLPGGAIATASYGTLYLSNNAGIYQSQTPRPAGTDYDNESELLVVGNRILRISHSDRPGTND